MDNESLAIACNGIGFFVFVVGVLWWWSGLDLK